MEMRGRITATIDEETYKEWKKYCEENSKNASSLLNRIIKEYLKKQKHRFW
jgi:hypothetical protein